jgi:hypothetical protein
MKILISILTLFIFGSIFLLSIACERSVPKDVMFCKSWEVLVLETPFDKESAKIVMYRGDEVKLMGDTIYHSQLDSTKKDSTDFCVKVTAKRGVVGWVHVKDLQKERIANVKQRKKQPNGLSPKKEEKTSNDSTDLKTDSLKTYEKTIKSDTTISN